MCGITGYNGNQQAAPILLSGLEKLEYRGYDSSGMAVRDGSRPIEIVKAKGRLRVLAEKTNWGKAMPGTCGIGHTRWATHGEPSENNAHPHCSDDRNVTAVHNGIIENYQELKEKLLKHNYHFYSETDTEVAVKLIDYYIKKYNEGPVDAIARAMTRIRGSYALAVMFKDYPDEIYAARKEAPMIIGVVKDASILASDVTAVLGFTKSVYYIGNMQIAKLGKGTVNFYNIDREEVQIEPSTVNWDTEAAERGGYEHFMIKEIHEQPKAVQDTLNALLEDDRVDLAKIGLTDEEAAKIRSVQIVACGSANHVGVAGQYIIEDMAQIPVRTELASEFRYRNPILDPANTLVVIVSQSGETADSLAALREAKKRGVKTFAIVNVVGSSIAREADYVFYTMAGPEIAVATTKAYSAQLIAIYALAVTLARVNGRMNSEQEEAFVKEMKELPAKISKILEDKDRIQWFAAKYANAKDVFFIGRGLDYAISMEGSLKLKEISYIHSEAYAAGELKHGTISLIEDGTLVIGVCTQKGLFEKTISNMVEVKTRGGYLMGLTSYGNYSIEDTADFTVYIPQTDEHLATSLAIVPLQLLAYYLSVAKGLNVDKPRNLAKSVTVE